MSKTLKQASAQTPLTRRQLLQLPPEARRPHMEEQAAAMAKHYHPCPDRDSWQEGDFFEY